MSFEYERNPRQEPAEGRVARIASRQHGVISRQQALACGIDDNLIHRRLASGVWQSLHTGVYRLNGVPKSWRQTMLAAVVAAGSEALLSHRAAAALLQLPSFERPCAELILPRGRRGTRVTSTFAIVHSADVPTRDRTVVDAIPLTRPVRTLFDIASVCDRGVVEEALDDALRRRIVSIPRLKWQLQQVAGRGYRGVTAMRALIEARSGDVSVPGSVFETRLLRLLTRAGLRPMLQHPIKHNGRLIAKVDFAYPTAHVVVEADGYEFHSGRARWEQDLARRNALTNLGWRVIHVTWPELEDSPDAVVESLRKALAGHRPSAR